MKYVFITGMGRSGTAFTANLLKQDPSIFVAHEFIGHREYHLLSWYLGRIYSVPFLKKVKEKIKQTSNKRYFVDVNGYLSDSSDSLKEVFEGAMVYHLVRNPRDVVRSLLIRRDDSRIHKLPKAESEINEWLCMSKLEQICINWVQTTEDLLNSNAEVLKFEELISSFEYLESKILSPLQINISKDQYELVKSKKTNKTRSIFYRFLYAKLKGKTFNPVSSSYQLSEHEQATLLKICGSTMKKLDYV